MISYDTKYRKGRRFVQERKSLPPNRKLAWLEELAFDSVGGVKSEEMTTRTCGDKEVRKYAIDFSNTCSSQSIPINIPILAELGRHSEHRPLRASENFEFQVPQSPKSLKKSRAVRAKSAILTVKNRDSALDNWKSEDPAKMTYSIPDFVNRNTINTQ